MIKRMQLIKNIISFSTNAFDDMETHPLAHSWIQGKKSIPKEVH